MRKLFAFSFTILSFCFSMEGQDYPAKWTEYVSERYIRSIEDGEYEKGTSQSAFINGLIDRARLNVAKQISISVDDKAQLIKESIRGVTNVIYASRTEYSTNLTMKLLHTDVEYNSTTHIGYAIAYLDKVEACGYWSKEAERVLTEIETGINNAEKMISQGYKERAKVVLESLPSRYDDMGDPLIWLSLCSYPTAEYEIILDRINICVKRVEDALLSLGHGIAIYIDYHSDLFGEEYLASLSQLSGSLSSSERSFVDNPIDADWIVKIDAKAREGQKTTLGAKTLYITYLDVYLTIIKTSTLQTIYKDSFTVKEGDTRDYYHAGSTAFKGISTLLFEPINNNISE